MRAENLPVLDAYVAEHIGTNTTRGASEERFECPPIPEALVAERAMRTTIHTMYDGKPPVDDTDLTDVGYEEDSLAALRRDYWEGAQHIGPDYGAYDDYTLDDYFRVHANRSYPAIRSSIEDAYPAEGPVVRLFDALDIYQDELGLEVTESARFLTTLFGVNIPHMAARASLYTEAGEHPAAAGDRAILDFIEQTVPAHVEELRERIARGDNLNAIINKPAQYPGYQAEVESQGDFRLSLETTRGVTTFYHIQERPYSDTELTVADDLMHQPAMQQAILLFHNNMIDFAKDYLGRHPDRMQHTLAPFIELFVIMPDAAGVSQLVPNPKLIKVIGNNAMPAVARVLLEEGVTAEDATGEHVRRGMELAKKLRMFHAQIGEFNGYDEDTGTVSLNSLFNSTCPAMQMFTSALHNDLSAMYDTCKAQQALAA